MRDVICRVGINSVRLFYINIAWQFFEYCLLSHCHTVTLSNHDELTLACAEKKAFYNYHSALQTTDDNFPTRLWNTNFVPNSELFFSGPYVRPDGEI